MLRIHVEFDEEAQGEVTVTEPLGTSGLPSALSFTEMVQLEGAFTGTVTGAHETVSWVVLTAAVIVNPESLDE